MLRLSVIVPATDQPATLDQCLRAISAADDPPEQVLVVDAPAGSGPAAARNRGAERADGDVLVFVDADVEVHPDAFRRIRAAFAADRGLGAIFGSYDDSPRATGTVSAFRNLLHHHVHQQGAGAAQTFWAGLGAVRRAAFAAVGGFDADRFPHASVEDIELGMRLSGDGARIVLDPAIQGTHLKRWTLRTMVLTDLFRRGIPWTVLLLRHRSAAAGLNLGWRHRLSAAAALAVVVSAALLFPIAVGAAVLALLCLNASFYRLLARRRGPLQAAAGVFLHLVHHLVSVAALVLGVGLYLARGRRDERPEGVPLGSSSA